MTACLEAQLLARMKTHAAAFSGRPPFPAELPQMQETARRAFVAAVVFVAVVGTALALWKLKLLIALVFLAFIIAAAMRPGVEALRRRQVPRGIGILLHYLGLAAVVGLLLWAAVPRAIDQVREALPTSSAEARQRAAQTTGIKHEVLKALEHRLEELPSASELVDPALEATRLTFEVFLGIFFTLASAAYWIFERDRAVDLVTSLLPRERRHVVRATWQLIDLKLGAYVRGQGLLILFVATVLSVTFWLIGLPFWILVGAFAGVVEIVPVIGPLVAGALAIGVGLTVSWQLALYAGLAVLTVRLLEDYVLIPRVLGDAVGLSPLLVLVSVFGVELLFGGFAVLLAIPIAAVIATLVQVIVLDLNPAEEEVPTVLFPAKDIESRG
jgi:predicted PurR-regulated permease PerM